MGELMAAVYDPLVRPLDRMGLRRGRQWAVRSARGIVLELGVGTGLNLPHYGAARAVAAVDPDGASLRRARERVDGSAHPIALYQANAEELPFADDSFDTVVGTLVFCTIADPVRGLREARRVLRSGGSFRLVEHVRVDNPIAAGVQDWITPVWKQVAAGCHLNRDTLGAVERAGFRVLAVHRHAGGLLIGIMAMKP